MKILCFYGEEEKDSLCRKLPPSLAKPIPFPGGHHFGGDYASIVETILGKQDRDAGGPRDSIEKSN
jgi:type IV secretory pathway VirJ component